MISFVLEQPLLSRQEECKKQKGLCFYVFLRSNHILLAAIQPYTKQSLQSSESLADRCYLFNCAPTFEWTRGVLVVDYPWSGLRSQLRMNWCQNRIESKIACFLTTQPLSVEDRAKIMLQCKKLNEGGLQQFNTYHVTQTGDMHPAHFDPKHNGLHFQSMPMNLLISIERLNRFSGAKGS